MAQLGFVAGASAHQSKLHNTAQREHSPGRGRTFAAVEPRCGCTVDHRQIRKKCTANEAFVFHCIQHRRQQEFQVQLKQHKEKPLYVYTHSTLYSHYQVRHLQSSVTQEQKLSTLNTTTQQHSSAHAIAFNPRAFQ